MIRNRIKTHISSRKVYKLMTLDQAYEYYKGAVEALETMVNVPGRARRSAITFSTFCDRLRMKGWRIL